MIIDTTNTIMQRIDAAHQMLVKLTERRNGIRDNPLEQEQNYLPDNTLDTQGKEHINTTA